MSRILQIIPADGWVVDVWTNLRDGKYTSTEELPIIAWALYEYEPGADPGVDGLVFPPRGNATRVDIDPVLAQELPAPIYEYRRVA